MKTADMKKGPSAPTLDPRKHKATDVFRVTPEPLPHEGPETRKVRELAADGLHPQDVGRLYLGSLDGMDRSGRLLAVRDLAIAIRRERGQKRRTAQALTDAALADLDLDEREVDHLLVTCAAQLTLWWAPRARWAPPVLGQQVVFVDLDGSLDA